MKLNGNCQITLSLVIKMMFTQGFDVYYIYKYIVILSQFAFYVFMLGTIC